MDKRPLGPPPIDLAAMHAGMDEVGIAFSLVAHIDDPLQEKAPEGFDETSLRAFYLAEAEKFLPQVANEAARHILQQTIASYRKKA